jgi:hypothetical protein
MKKLFLLILGLMLGINAQAQRIIISPIIPGGGGSVSGGSSNAYSFNGPFTVVNDTNVFLHASITNIVLTGVITNAPWTTNLAVGYDLGAAISNLPNNSVVNVLPGTHNVTPVIWATNGGVFRYPPITIQNKTNVVINIAGATINGHAALGTIMLITNCDNVTIQGDGLFDGLVQTNIATLIPTNVTWGLISYYHCSNLKFKDFKLWNAHYHGIIDWGGAFGSICSTNGILFEGLDIRNTGSITTNNPIPTDGTAIVPTGGTVRNCYFRDNLRAIEPYVDANNIIVDNTIIENNEIFDTLDAPITTSGSTNNNKIIIRNNFIYQTRGYTRRGMSYTNVSNGILIHMNGGHGHSITGNRGISTNGPGIVIGGHVMNNIETSDNYFELVTSPIIYGLDSPGQSPHNNITALGNVSFNTAGGLQFNGCRNGLIGYNFINEFTASFAVGIDVSSIIPNTNLFLIGNKVKDTSGNLYTSYFIRANADRIIMSDNDGTNGTQSFIENSAGTGLIYRGQRNNDGVIFYSESLATAGNVGVFDEVYGAGWNGSTNVPTKNAVYDKIESLSPGGGGTNFLSALVTNQVIHVPSNVSGLFGTTTNLTIDFTLFSKYGTVTNLPVDITIALSNAFAVTKASIFLLGQTNGATNHNIAIKAEGGATINWMSSTNGTYAFTLYSNSVANVFFEVTTNQVATNIYARWETDSVWPQRNQTIIASAGGSTSNLTVGGLIYYDGQKYTNHSNAQNVTNYANVMLGANLLTNDGDMIVGEWDIQHQVTSDGTNQFFIGFGTITNIFNTGNITNKANAAAKLRCEITRTGNSSQHIFCEYKVFGLNNIWYGTATNAEIAATCGVTNILRMHGRKAGVNTPGNVGNHTNNQFRVWYHPMPR